MIGRPDGSWRVTPPGRMRPWKLAPHTELKPSRFDWVWSWLNPALIAPALLAGHTLNWVELRMLVTRPVEMKPLPAIVTIWPTLTFVVTSPPESVMVALRRPSVAVFALKNDAVEIA